MAQVIGIDLGGTAIKLARFSTAGNLLQDMEIATPQPAMPGAVTMAICEAVERLDPTHDAAWVGPRGRWMLRLAARVCINLPGWRRCCRLTGWSHACNGGHPGQ